MVWKEQLEEYESNEQWPEAIRLLEAVVKETPDKSEPAVRFIYLLHNILVEGHYEKHGLDHDYLANLLLRFFQESFSKFEHDPEYLFFVGIITHIAEWYFGQDDVQFALKLQKRAWEIEPENILFEFSYAFSTSDRERAKELAGELEKDAGKLQWLRSKGYPGQYVLELINAVQEDRV